MIAGLCPYGDSCRRLTRHGSQLFYNIKELSISFDLDCNAVGQRRSKSGRVSHLGNLSHCADECPTPVKQRGSGANADWRETRGGVELVERSYFG